MDKALEEKYAIATPVLPPSRGGQGAKLIVLGAFFIAFRFT